MILLKDKENTYPKDILKAVANLKGNSDFGDLMQYLIAVKTNCAAQACLSVNDSIAKKFSGGFIGFSELEQLVDSAEDEIEKLKNKEKEPKKKSFA